MIVGENQWFLAYLTSCIVFSFNDIYKYCWMRLSKLSLTQSFPRDRRVRIPSEMMD
jgi:hypothetical protein